MLEEAIVRGLLGVKPAEIWAQIARSLVLSQGLPAPLRYCDVGPGSGLPGIPLSILYEGGVLVEPKLKAAAFLEEVIGSIAFDCTVYAQPAELVSRGELRERFDLVSARALGPPLVAAELCAPLLAVGGTLVLTGSPSKPLPTLAASLGLGEVSTEILRGPFGITQTVHRIAKQRPTSDKIPRKAGRARRSPLGAM